MNNTIESHAPSAASAHCAESSFPNKNTALVELLPQQMDLRGLARAYRHGDLSREEYRLRRRSLLQGWQAQLADNPNPSVATSNTAASDYLEPPTDPFPTVSPFRKQQQRHLIAVQKSRSTSTRWYNIAVVLLGLTLSGLLVGSVAFGVPAWLVVG